MSGNNVKVKKQTIDPSLTLEDVKKQLIEKGKKEGHLSHEEIAEKLQNFEMDSDQMDELFDQLTDNDISLVNEKDSSDKDFKLNPNDLDSYYNRVIAINEFKQHIYENNGKIIKLDENGGEIIINYSDDLDGYEKNANVLLFYLDKFQEAIEYFNKLQELINSSTLRKNWSEEQQEYLNIYADQNSFRNGLIDIIDIAHQRYKNRFPINLSKIYDQ